MENENKTLHFKIEKTRLSDREFVRCCFLLCGKVIGDFEQRMLFGNFKLAVSDLIARVKNLPLHDFKSSGEIGDIFMGMTAAFLKEDFYFFQKIPEFTALYEFDSMSFFALPVAIEAFDGEEAYLFVFENQWLICWRQWETKKISSIPINRDAFIEILESALNE